jgi:hypothetical protein
MATLLLRRIHLYAGLFLIPWVLAYALSTMAMNHRHLFQKPNTAPQWTKRTERTFDGVITAEAPAAAQAAVILGWLGIDGANNARLAKDGALVIQRQRLIDPLRITYTPVDRRVVIEGQPAKASAFLERIHRRRGFDRDYAADDVWAFLVDAFIAAMIFWVASGLWLWWKMKATRRFGLACALAGLAIFAFYAAVL